MRQGGVCVYVVGVLVWVCGCVCVCVFEEKEKRFKDGQCVEWSEFYLLSPE